MLLWKIKKKSLVSSNVVIEENINERYKDILNFADFCYHEGSMFFKVKTENDNFGSSDLADELNKELEKYKFSIASSEKDYIYSIENCFYTPYPKEVKTLDILPGDKFPACIMPLYNAIMLLKNNVPNIKFLFGRVEIKNNTTAYNSDKIILEVKNNTFNLKNVMKKPEKIEKVYAPGEKYEMLVRTYKTKGINAFKKLAKDENIVTCEGAQVGYPFDPYINDIIILTTYINNKQHYLFADNITSIDINDDYHYLNNNTEPLMIICTNIKLPNGKDLIINVGPWLNGDSSGCRTNFKKFKIENNIN